MKYVDGYVIPVRKDSVDKYIKIAQMAGRIWKEHGALEYRECAGEDLATKIGLPFPRALNARADETIFFSWVVFNSRAHRDEVNAKVMADERLKEMTGEGASPFDCGRMIYGGFDLTVDI